MDLTTTTAKYAAIMLAVGIAVPIMAAMNAGLGQRLANPAAAASVLFAMAFITAFGTMLLSGVPSKGMWQAAPVALFFAGILIAFYVLAITSIAPKFGVGNAVFFVLLGQMISAAAIDHFGLMGARVDPITWTRATGIAVMALGVFITQRG
ncbi:hypothetical protein RB2150_05668 [Rhodobacterales bacterium HTCC2150]|nr:hypothetical protein RB2150_05668 [Rhodobacterales bacterium HTCC2150] [Rhodobacteraceae bacterium HTCC2150]